MGTLARLMALLAVLVALIRPARGARSSSFVVDSLGTKTSLATMHYRSGVSSFEVTGTIEPVFAGNLCLSSSESLQGKIVMVLEFSSSPCSIYELVEACSRRDCVALVAEIHFNPVLALNTIMERPMSSSEFPSWTTTPAMLVEADWLEHDVHLKYPLSATLSSSEQPSMHRSPILSVLLFAANAIHALVNIVLLTYRAIKRRVRRQLPISMLATEALRASCSFISSLYIALLPWATILPSRVYNFVSVGSLTHVLLFVICCCLFVGLIDTFTWCTTKPGIAKHKLIAGGFALALLTVTHVVLLVISTPNAALTTSTALGNASSVVSLLCILPMGIVLRTVGTRVRRIMAGTRRDSGLGDREIWRRSVFGSKVARVGVAVEIYAIAVVVHVQSAYLSLTMFTVTLALVNIVSNTIGTLAIVAVVGTAPRDFPMSKIAPIINLVV